MTPFDGVYLNYYVNVHIYDRVLFVIPMMWVPQFEFLGDVIDISTWMISPAIYIQPLTLYYTYLQYKVDIRPFSRSRLFCYIIIMSYDNACAFYTLFCWGFLFVSTFFRFSMRELIWNSQSSIRPSQMVFLRLVRI